MVNFNLLKILQKLHIKLEKLKLNLSFDTEDVNITSYSTVFFSTFIGTLIGICGNNNNNNYKFIITPVYNNKKFFIINLNCIFKVKLVHIINVIFLIIQKRSEVKYARTSNRRTYDYSNE